MRERIEKSCHMLVFFTMLLLWTVAITGCGGWGTYESKISATQNLDFNIAGGANATKMYTFDVNVLTNTVQNLVVDAVSYNVDINTGGAGTLTLAYTTPGTACATVPPLESIQFSAATTFLNDVPVLPQTLTEINNRLNSTYRVCMGLNQVDVNNPVNIHITFPITASATIKTNLF